MSKYAGLNKNSIVVRKNAFSSVSNKKAKRKHYENFRKHKK